MGSQLDRLTNQLKQLRRDVEELIGSEPNSDFQVICYEVFAHMFDHRLWGLFPNDVAINYRDPATIQRRPSSSPLSRVQMLPCPHPQTTSAPLGGFFWAVCT